MAINETKRISVFKPSVSRRLGAAPPYANGHGSGTAVCKFWLAGNCNRKDCRFAHHLPNTYCRDASQQLHDGSARANTYHSVPQQSDRDSTLMMKSCSASKEMEATRECPWKNGTDKGDSHTSPPQSGDVTPLKPTSTKKINKLCAYWAIDKCAYGDSCKYVHAWSVGTDFCSFAKLEGHNKDITGIALPSGSNKLYSGSRDGSVRLWNCYTGKCAQIIDLDDEIGSLISEGPWIFVGMPNVVKAWNVQTHEQFDLCGPVGQVYAMVVSTSNDMLCAGTQDGSILAWKGSMESSPFQEIASLKGHNLPVLALVVASNRLYSGSSDHTIRVWDMTTLQCLHILCGHSDAVMSVLCWDQYLLSCSLDQTIKVWACSGGGNLEVVYTHEEEHGVLALVGMYDADAKPVLYRSCNDNSVCVYELPSFAERGRLFSKHKVRAIQIGPGGLFFTGDGSGSLTVWKWSENSQDTFVNAERAMCI